MPFLFALFILPSLFSCSHTQKEEKASAKATYEKALKQKENRQFVEALETLRKLRKQFIHSSYSARARLLMGDIYFEMEDYPLAAQEYEKFIKIYSSKKRGYALYQLGLTYLKRLPSTADRDLSHSKKALSYFRELQNLKKPDPHKKMAKKHIHFLLSLLAEKELLIASFYERRGWKEAAMKRLEYLLHQYPNTPFIPKALLLAWELSEGKNTKKFKNRLLKEFPSSPEANQLNKTL
ncbi:MAG: outer membrane protein assembly factor BamD [Bdellovibrionales bacterium]|nr:outer membrane protein assembly factor BamD [Bdellovibrionales bacterium]